MSHWLQIEAEHVLGVDRGRDVILVDRAAHLIGSSGGTLLIRVSDDTEKKLYLELCHARGRL